jgi:hypothetical protein
MQSCILNQKGGKVSTLAENAMWGFLSRSISSLNRNKVNGPLAEVELRLYSTAVGFGDRISPGGRIARQL